MQGVTLIIAIIGSLLVLVLKPVRALAAYLCVLLWYPDYLAVSIGTVDISISRIIVTVLIFRCIFNKRLSRGLTWCSLDSWVLAATLINVFIYCSTRPFMAALENRAGAVMDTWFPYMVARYCITDRDSFISFIKIVAVVLIPLSLLGMVGSVTGWQPYVHMQIYCPWRVIVQTFEARWGLERAWGAASHPIMFGVIFSMFLPFIWALRDLDREWKKKAYIISGFAILGTLSSMSSTTWMMLFFTLFCLFMQRLDSWVKSLLVFIVLVCVFIEIGSNQSWYGFIASKLNFLGGSWWQRVVIINSAIRDIGEWFWLGYKGRDPGWGSGAGMSFTDLNNQFILAGVQIGILGVITLCGILVVAYTGLVRGYRKAVDRGLKSLYWSFGSMLTAVICIWMAVSFFGQTTIIFYAMLGTLASSLFFVNTERAHIMVPRQYVSYKNRRRVIRRTVSS